MFVNKTGRHLYFFKSFRVNLARKFASAEPDPIKSTTINEKDVAHFQKLSSTWWDANGPMRSLHSLNTVRVPFIRDGLLATNEVAQNRIRTTRVLDGFKILEVGCGGGFLTENLARLHAKITGIDAGKDIIEAAEKHLCEHSSELADRIEYKSDTIENFAKNHSNEYDAVIMSEVIEHVENAPTFISAAVDTVKPGGSVFVTIPNRSILMYVSGIFIAENILNLVPRGSHQWEKFITPLEMQRILESLNCSTVMVNGYFYEFWRNTWRWVPSTQFCYAMHAIKRIEDVQDGPKTK